jgi:drug/metabolite transporter (DMT)-like permease
MNGRLVLALVLIVVGVVAIVYQGFSFTTRKKVLDVGPIQATREERHSVPLPPILGAIALVGGVIVLVSGRRSS